MTLADLQARFAEALLNGSDATVVSLLDDGRLPPTALLDVYRGSIFAGLTSTLAGTFPLVHRALGEAAFRHAAEAFIRACPPTTPCLRDYGDRFPTFIAGGSAGPDWAPLSDLARREWEDHVSGTIVPPPVRE